jgi:rhodanese-related sulfurtransferase
MLNRPIPTVDVREARQRLTDESANGLTPVLVDVREVSEFLQVRAEQAVLLPLSQFMVRYQELPRDRPLLMICASGGRSMQATAFLLSAGFNDVSNVSGGTLGWLAAGLPTRSGPVGPDEEERPF